MTTACPRPSGPPPGADPYGLLSGRNHPYGVDPNAPTRYDPPAGPTQYIPPDPGQYQSDPTQVIPFRGRGGKGRHPPGEPFQHGRGRAGQV